MANAKDKLRDYFLNHIGEDIPRETLRHISGDIQDWQRALRQLRQETGLNIISTQIGYILTSATPVREALIRKPIDAKLRYAVLQRDGSRCQRCGRGINEGVKLAIDHMVPVDMGGETTMDNLWTLCTECNGGKQSFFSDGEANLIREINELGSAKAKLKKYFEKNPNKLIDPVKLGIVAGVRDWERVIRKLRAEENMNIVSIRPSKENPLGGYYYEF